MDIAILIKMTPFVLLVHACEELLFFRTFSRCHSFIPVGLRSFSIFACSVALLGTALAIICWIALLAGSFTHIVILTLCVNEILHCLSEFELPFDRVYQLSFIMTFLGMHWMSHDQSGYAAFKSVAEVLYDMGRE